MATDGIGQRFQQGGGLADPVGQGGAVEIEAFAVEDLALAIKRQVVGILADQHMGQQARAGAATLDRARGQRGLDEAFAAGAGQPRADNPVHDEAARGRIPVLRSHPRRSGAGARRSRHRHRRPGVSSTSIRGI